MVEKLSVVVELVGGKQVEQEVTGIANAFDGATKSIAALGTTGAEALNSAAAAAQKFGASTQQLKQVESVISGLNARARDGHLTFSQLATNYDSARSNAGRFAQATQQVGAAIAETGRKVSSFRPQLTALSASMAAVGLPFGGLVSALGRVGLGFGILAGGAVAIAGAASALIKFATAASETEKTLTQLQKVSGASFENLSALQQVFAAGGTPLKQFASEFGNLSEKVAEAGQQAAIRRADKDVVQWANDVGNVARNFDLLARGIRVAENPLTTLDTKVKGLLESLALSNTVFVAGALDKTKLTEEQWLRLADIFKNLGSDMERAQIGKKLGLSPESIATLSQGSAKIKELQAEAQRLGLTLTTSNQTALQGLGAQWNEFTALLSALFQKIGAAAAPALLRLLESFKPVMQGIAADFENLPLPQAIANLGNRLAPAFRAIGDLLLPILTQIGEALGSAIVQGMKDSLQQGAGPAVQSIFSSLPFSWAVNIGLAIGKAIVGGAQQAVPGGGPAPTRSEMGFAGGGLLGGRGTGTSDSNLAWVSRGEHIMPARTVAQPGVLALLEALRRSGGNLGRVLDGMGRFALGGMVPRAMPAFASGGMAGGMSNVTIQFPGLPDIGGLRASASTVDELRRAAALAQVRSGGRKPSRYS